MTTPDLDLLTDPAMVERAMRLMSPDERAEFMALVAADPALWRPQVGRQMLAAQSPADIIGYGGAAGGGKSDLIAGLALTEHHRTLVFRQQKAQTEGIVQRMEEILGSRDGYSSQHSEWKVGDRLIEFAGLDNPGDHQKWQGRPHDLKAYDEVTEMREFQVRFTMGWNRTSKTGQRTRTLMTFNPPQTAEARWVIQFFAPWLDDKHPNPAADGELRWFTTLHGKDFEVPSGDQFVMFKGEPLYDFDPEDFTPEKIIQPKSRTFISSRVTDNYVYVKSGYIAQLQTLPEPLRSMLLHGDFKAGIEDDPWQVIPTLWIDKAMERWQARDEGKKGEMDTMGVDVAVGGRDEFVMAPRHGTWFDQLIITPSHEIKQERAGPITAGLVMSYRRDRAVVHVDVIGWGLTTANFLTENEVQIVAINAANKTTETSADGKFKFANFRAMMVWRMREALDPDGASPVDLPPDPQLRADLAAYKWKLKPNGIIVGSKDEMKTELGRSPDRGDAVCMANLLSMKQEVFDEMRRDRDGYDRYSELS